MAKFNKSTQSQVAVKSPIATKVKSTGKTFEGAPGFEHDAKSELFLLAVANMVSEKTFYEDAGARDQRFENLVTQVAVEDPAWFAAFVGWLRGPQGNMRSASLVAAAVGVKALLDAKSPAAKRGIVSSVLQRADEPGELLGYWLANYGRSIPKPVKRGVADAIQRLYNEYGTLKYDTQSSGIRFGDVLAMVHPDPVAPWQAELFGYINARRWGREDESDPGALPMVHARRIADAMSRDELITSPNIVQGAGYTWENIAGRGKMDAQAWEAVIPSMGYMALLRNLRNFDQTGISDEATTAVMARIMDPEQVAKSRQFPFRFLSAYQAVRSENWGRALERALSLSTQNVPALAGNTLVLVDRSGSMQSPAGGSLSDMTRADVAALFGVSLALRSENVDLIEFGSTWAPVKVQAGDSVLKTIGKFHWLGGTNTQETLAATFKPGYHKRVVIVTDEQATWVGYRRMSGAISDPVGTGLPDDVYLHAWNLAGYQYAQSPGAKNHFWYGGLTDAAFKMIPLVEKGRNADWNSLFGG